MPCRLGRHAVGLRINILRTCTEQQTVQALTHGLYIYIHTHTSDKSQRYYPLQVQYIFRIYLLKHRYIGNNDHTRETWDPEHPRLDVNDTRQCMCYNLQAWTWPQATTVKNLHSNTTKFRTKQD